ncbi:hypothetical protein QUF51_08190 [Bacillus pumilus]|nr:hypothetical protein [Bacillus pumilus]
MDREILELSKGKSSSNILKTELISIKDNLEKANVKLKDALIEIDSLTRNPREYEPSLYTINHIVREALIK